MDKNVGGVDRRIRTILAPFLFLAGFVATLTPNTFYTIIGVLSLIVSVIFGVTAYTQQCPANKALGINTYSSTQ